MQRMLVHREQREPGIIGLADGAAWPVLIDVAFGEILEIAAVAFTITMRAYVFRDRNHPTSPMLSNLSGQASVI
jgi:hypothetical protein